MIDCDCSDRVLTRRTIQSGHNSWVAYQWQCRACGSSSQMIGRATLSQSQLESAEPYDEGARERHWEAKRREWSDRRAEQEAERLAAVEERREFYRSHMESAKWAAIRAKVLERDRNTCQGCLEAKATQVHHLTYDRLGDELMCDLISLCRRCHERIHGLQTQMAVIGRSRC